MSYCHSCGGRLVDPSLKGPTDVFCRYCADPQGNLPAGSRYGKESSSGSRAGNRGSRTGGPRPGWALHEGDARLGREVSRYPAEAIIRSAKKRSSGRVILRFVGSPMTVATGWPTASMAAASSGRSSPWRFASA